MDKGEEATAEAGCGQQEGPGFEEALGRLEEIVAELERGNTSLDKSLAFYEEGIRAYKTCHQMLQEAEGKVAKLVQTLEGTLKEEPIDLPEEE
ncbi:MAG: exodeoxyribonuclease VII small subunit [Candidatus Brocadiia bacterium]|jgi:exodeoxyribonuclease VII small subunit|nr:exodeoxyribonuclease VII small subunit [Candidatus Brocadiia bacterium]